MVIVVGLAIVIFWVGGVFLRRHFTRKHEAARANLAASDAPYHPSTPGSHAPMSTGVTPQPMTMSGARSSTITVDGGVGGIAPPRGGPLRSRTNTLQSLTMGNGSRTNVASQPVVWGPHQHLAQGNGSPVNSVPPSPTSAITPPNPILRNSQALRSEPRFVQFRQTPTSPLSGDPRANPHGDGIMRPHSTGTGRVGSVRTHSMNAVRSDPTLTPHYEPQSAEIVESSPHKLTKHQH
ncbi:hypothetical protein P154DRAFT_95580 [Amniculicola lignicola CBS 123094]|uniref:Uncharacterized protein n=1 Tax=Amniculicola lignicola CBS 123094 TaxID=1392246 RepID=A0A6A5WPA7_9PLEO|nr:hypothetical protein P154DRAFT_95580 [Amniculicola lignicola CBS 123094]